MESDYYVINPLSEKNHGRVKRNSHGSIPHVIFRLVKILNGNRIIVIYGNI